MSITLCKSHAVECILTFLAVRRTGHALCLAASNAHLGSAPEVFLIADDGWVFCHYVDNISFKSWPFTDIFNPGDPCSSI